MLLLSLLSITVTLSVYAECMQKRVESNFLHDDQNGEKIGRKIIKKFSFRVQVYSHNCEKKAAKQIARDEKKKAVGCMTCQTHKGVSKWFTLP